MQADSCPEHQCDDPTHETPVVVPPLPSPSGGGGHEFVTELPEIGTPGVEYILMGDPRDCSSFKGSYVWNNDCWVATSGAGGGALDTYTFEKTTTGWVAKKNGKVIFTYNDERITQLITDVTNIDNRVTNVEGDVANINTRVTTNTTNININKNDITNIKNDIYGDYLKNRIAVCEDSPLTLSVDETNPQAKKIILCMDETKVGDKSDGAYQIKGQLSTYLSTSLLGTTPVNIVNVPDLYPNDIVLGETYLYDNQGTMGVVKAYNKTTGIMTVTTMTTSPGERSGVRLGSVELVTDLPATITAAEGLGWLTPVEGDFAYVRDDDGKLAEYLVQSIDGSGNITWVFSHYINAGNYVVDILTDKGVLIPKNPDGTVTLPVNDRIKTIYLADGTALPVDANYAVTLPDFIKGAVLKDGTVLPVNANKQIVLPDFGTLKGVMTHDGTDLVIDANGKVTLPRYVKGIKDSDGNLLTMDVDDVITLPAPTEKYDNYEIDLSTKDIATDIDSNITIPVADITDILKKGATMTTAAFMADVTANRDLVFIHGLDGTKKTQEAIAYYVSGDANNLVFRVLAIPKAGSGGGAADKEVPEYTRDLHAGDVINHLELITYDNILYRMIDTAPYTLTGTWSTDKTHFEVINSEAKNTYYNINRTGEELSSWAGQFAAHTYNSLASTTMPIKEVSVGKGNKIKFNSGTNSFTLAPNTRYEVLTTMAAKETNANLYYNLRNITDSVNIDQVQWVDQESAQYAASGSMVAQFTTPDHPIEVDFRAAIGSQNATTTTHEPFCSIAIKEIGRIVDPIAYMLNDGNAQEMPVGSLIQTMSNSAPKHYLICDGSEYAIGTYPELEAHFVKEFGAVDHFGGTNGKWKVPDLRGEFLRVAGTNSHINTITNLKEGNGADVGAHQEASVLPQSWSGTGANVTPINYTENMKKSADTLKPFSKVGTNGWNTTNTYGGTAGAQTVRPTNTSVNVAIKCESTPRVIVDQGTYKASVKCSVSAAPSAGSAQFRFDGSDIIGDTTMVDTTTNEFIAPVDGMYAVGCQTTASGTGGVSNYLSINGVITCWGRGINPMGTVYLKTGDRVSLNMYGGSSAQTGRANIALVNIVEKNIAEVMLKPNTWAVGVEQNFGDGVYGYRVQIASLTTTPATGSGKATALLQVLPASLKAKHVLDWGGTYLNSNDYFWSIPGSYTGSEHILYISNHTGVPNGNDEWSITITETTPGTMRNFDIWVLYSR